MTVSEQIIQVLDALCKKFGVVIDWTSNNIVPYLKTLSTKFISYEIVTSIFWVSLCTILCAASWGIATYFIKKAKAIGWDDDSVSFYMAIVMIAVSILFSIVFVVVVPIQIYDIIQAKVFPEKTIYEFISNELSLLNN